MRSEGGEPIALLLYDYHHREPSPSLYARRLAYHYEYKWHLALVRCFPMYFLFSKQRC